MKIILKYIAGYALMVGGYALGTLIILGLIFYGLGSLIDWIFGTSLLFELDYYFDKIFVSGPMWFRYFKLWLLGIPLTYLNNIRWKGWKISEP